MTCFWVLFTFQFIYFDSFLKPLIYLLFLLSIQIFYLYSIRLIIHMWVCLIYVPVCLINVEMCPIHMLISFIHMIICFICLFHCQSSSLFSKILFVFRWRKKYAQLLVYSSHMPAMQNLFPFAAVLELFSFSWKKYSCISHAHQCHMPPPPSHVLPSVQGQRLTWSVLERVPKQLKHYVVCVCAV